MPKPLATWNTARDAWETFDTEGLFCEHLAVFSETWPTSGMVRHGLACELPMWEPATGGTASLFLPGMSPESGRLPTLPTPSAALARNGGSQHPGKRRAGGHSAQLHNVIEQELAPLNLLPTPTATPYGYQRGLGGQEPRPSLETMAREGLLGHSSAPRERQSGRVLAR